MERLEEVRLETVRKNDYLEERRGNDAQFEHLSPEVSNTLRSETILNLKLESTNMTAF